MSFTLGLMPPTLPYDRAIHEQREKSFPWNEGNEAATLLQRLAHSPYRRTPPFRSAGCCALVPRPLPGLTRAAFVLPIFRSPGLSASKSNLASRDADARGPICCCLIPSRGHLFGKCASRTAHLLVASPPQTASRFLRAQLCLPRYAR
jgi:hypothetical protein